MLGITGGILYLRTGYVASAMNFQVKSVLFRQLEITFSRDRNDLQNIQHPVSLLDKKKLPGSSQQGLLDLKRAPDFSSSNLQETHILRTLRCDKA